MSITKEYFKKELLELIQDDPSLILGNCLEEAIYIIDEIVIYGDFQYGSRGVDHNVLKSYDVEWEEILDYGTLIVPETLAYISDEINQDLEDIGYTRLPLYSNHIMGF